MKKIWEFFMPSTEENRVTLYWFLAFIGVGIVLLVWYQTYWATVIAAGLALFFSLNRFNSQKPAHIAFFVFAVFSLLAWGKGYVGSSEHIQDVKREQQQHINAIEPELYVSAGFNSDLITSVGEMRKAVDSIGNRKLVYYRLRHAQFLSQGWYDSANFYAERIIAVQQETEAAKKPLEAAIRSVQTVSRTSEDERAKSHSAGYSQTFVVPADSLTNLDFVMNGGRTYKLVSNRRFKMKCSDGMFYDIPTELTWPIKEAGVFIPIVLASRELKLTITDVTEDM